MTVDISLLRTYRDRLKSVQILLSRTQAGPGRKVKQEQEHISRNRVPFSADLCTLESIDLSEICFHPRRRGVCGRQDAEGGRAESTNDSVEYGVHVRQKDGGRGSRRPTPRGGWAPEDQNLDAAATGRLLVVLGYVVNLSCTLLQVERRPTVVFEYSRNRILWLPPCDKNRILLTICQLDLDFW